MSYTDVFVEAARQLGLCWRLLNEGPPTGVQKIALGHGRRPRSCAYKAGARDDVLKNSFKRLAPALARELREVEVRRNRLRAEAERQKAEARFTSVLAMAPDAMVAADENRRIIAFNHAAEVLFGYGACEAIGQSLDLLLPLRSSAAQRRQIAAFMRAGTGVRRLGEMMGRRKSGEEFLAEISVSKLIDDGGTTFLAVVRDLTRRKQAEQALRQEAQRLEAAVKAGNVGLWHWDLSTNTAQFSREWKAQIGYRGDEISDSYMEWESRLHPDDRAGTLALLREYLGGKRDDYEVEFRLRHKDGSYRWILAQGKVVEGTDGASVVMLGSHVDISARKHAEDALRRSEASLARAQQIAGLGSWELDLLTGANIWSDEMCRLFGLPPGSPGLSFEAFVELIHPDDRPAVFDTRETILRTGAGATVEYRSNPGKGPVRQFRATIVPTTDIEGRVVATTGAVLDVTQIRETEGRLIQAQKMESLGNLAGGIAHDFNNMLVPIRALTELTKAKLASDSPLQENLDAILEAGMRATELVRKIMTFSRRDERQSETTDISACVAGAVALVRNVLPATITLVDEISLEVGKVTSGAAQLQSIVLNMVANAAYATGGEVGRITIGLVRIAAAAALAGRQEKLAKGQALAKLTIADTGGGMNAATLNKIFDPFFTTKPLGEGTGLGLAMVHGIAEAMGGAIEVASTVGVGTTFDIYLPLLDGETST